MPRRCGIPPRRAYSWDLDHPIESDVLICSVPNATEVTFEIVSSIPNSGLDAGGLSQATPIESPAAVLLQLNMTTRPGPR